jgi:hypothetical protein
LQQLPHVHHGNTKQSKKLHDTSVVSCTKEPACAKPQT